MTYNSSWQEIGSINNSRKLKIEDRPDISCIRTVNGTCEIYYMRILLIVQRDYTICESIRTVNGITYSNFQDACYSMELLCDDRKFITPINKIAKLAFGHQLRKLFVMLLISNSISKPYHDMTDDELKNFCLIEIGKILNNNARSLRDYQSMPYPELSDVHFFQNKLIEEELAYDTNEFTYTNLYTEQKITHEQSKTFIWNELSSAFWPTGKIVLNVASSRIASLLLPGGRTAHSRFPIPIINTDEYTCNIKHGSLKAELLIQNSLII
ncbi:hypothetical protein Ahy_A07g036599 [Arachis hypogaea]|uniref:ATP-dependent DNA helicase n=1 Tax=Arachis hypogaea TaxID=3818 RepID=A0A445CGK4_ARAHY|nr:hypothetical protein Ahy_A07g036599 [Arachis hypogaea]